MLKHTMPRVQHTTLLSNGLILIHLTFVLYPHLHKCHVYVYGRKLIYNQFDTKIKQKQKQNPASTYNLLQKN